MDANTFRFIWTVVPFYVIGAAAPAVMLGGSTWGKSIASAITSALFGTIIFICMFAAVAALHAVYDKARSRIAGYRNA